MLRDGVVSAGTALVQAEHPFGDARVASLYDEFEFDADAPLYSDLAHAEGGRVLEVACGSGRLLLPLVRAGHSVVGIDISPHMLEIAREKLRKEPEGHRARLVHADMREFDLGESFDVAVVAVKSFAYLTEHADQLRCVERIASHLRPGGVLAIDLLHPRPEWVGAADGSMRDDLISWSAERRVTVSRVESVVATDLARQVRTIRSIYEVIDEHGVPMLKRIVEWPYRYMYRFEAEHLLERAGFRIEAVYGGYQREPFTSSSAAMLFVCRRTSGIRQRASR